MFFQDCSEFLSEVHLNEEKTGRGRERNWDSFASKIMNGGEISTRLAADCVGAGKSLNRSATEGRGKNISRFYFS